MTACKLLFLKALEGDKEDKQEGLANVKDTSVDAAAVLSKKTGCEEQRTALQAFLGG